MQDKNPNTLFPVQLEVFHCPSCDGALPEHHVFREDLPIGAVSRRKVTVYCEHCNAAWSRNFVANCGVFLPDSDVERITNFRALGIIRRKVARNNNDRLSALSA